MTVTDDLERERERRRAYPESVPAEAVDHGVSAVFEEFPGNSWREATLREVVGVVLAAHVRRVVPPLLVDRPDPAAECRCGHQAREHLSSYTGPCAHGACGCRLFRPKGVEL